MVKECKQFCKNGYERQFGLLLPNPDIDVEPECDHCRSAFNRKQMKKLAVCGYFVDMSEIWTICVTITIVFGAGDAHRVKLHGLL